MQIEDILHEVNKADAGSKTMLIEKYNTSDGAVKDYVIKLLPPDGYHALVRESLEQLQKETNKFMHDIRPADADMAEWAQAITEQVNSFNNSLMPSETKAARNYTKELVKLGAAYVEKQELESKTIQTAVLKNLVVLSSVNHTPEKAAKVPKGNVPRYKEIIRSNLPISAYLGQLNLAPGKVASVRAVDMPAGK